MKISCIVITKNEEKNIADCLESVKWADEIIIVDSYSEDKTCKIASQFTSKIFSIDSDSFAEKRKYSFTLARNEWILFLDADERISPELKIELQLIDELNINGVSGFRINRRNYCFGKWLKYGGQYPDFQLRLFRKNNASVIERPVHEGIKLNGFEDKLQNDIIHYSYSSLEQMLNKINLYSTLEAEEHYKMNKIVSKIGVFTHAVSAFIRVFISRKAYKDKLPGFFISFSYSMVNFLSHLKLLKLQGKI
jgi:glycosyltransferase involved in cell wall biosynthesis